MGLDKMGIKKTHKKRIFFTTLIFFILLSLFYHPTVSAEEYTAAIDISVNESGYVTITGHTNYPDLLVENTERYTSKKQGIWTINITKKEVFSEYTYELKLPKGASISGIKTSKLTSIRAESDSIIIKGYGENESFSLVVQYKINPSSLDWNVLFIFGFLITIVSIYLVYSIFQERRKKHAAPDKEIDSSLDPYFKGLNSRQKQIIKLLIDSNRSLTQTDIQKELDIPKAAVSRNIHSLEIKGLIEIEKSGMSNLVRLKKK